MNCEIAKLSSEAPKENTTNIVRDVTDILKRVIPPTGEKTPAIGLGTWQTFDAGNSSDERAALKEVLKSFTTLGGGVIDSSPMYGSSEKVVGDLTQELQLREKLFLATKIWTSGRQAGIEQMNTSFQNMKTVVMDLMQVHNLLDCDVHIQTLREWKAKESIRYIGVTHYRVDAYPRLMQLIKNEALDFVQFNYNIKVREAERVLLPLAKDMGVAVLINRPFEEGALFSLVKGKNLPQWAKESDINSWGQFFLKYILSHSAVTCVIPASSSVKHVEDNMEAAYGKLPDEAMRKKMAEYMDTI